MTSSSESPSAGSRIFAASNYDRFKYQSIDTLVCSNCEETKKATDCWWCRDCAVSICSACNLLCGHTEHRTSPWSQKELSKAAYRALRERCQVRSNQAAELEVAVKEYLAELEAYFLARLGRRLQKLNEQDQRRMQILASNFGFEGYRVTFLNNETSRPSAASQLDNRIQKTMTEMHKLGLHCETKKLEGKCIHCETGVFQTESVAESASYRHRYFGLPTEASMKYFTDELEDKLIRQTMPAQSSSMSFSHGSPFASTEAPTASDEPEISPTSSSAGSSNSRSSKPNRTSESSIPIEPTIKIVNGSVTVMSDSITNGDEHPNEPPRREVRPVPAPSVNLVKKRSVSATKSAAPAKETLFTPIPLARTSSSSATQTDVVPKQEPPTSLPVDQGLSQPNTTDSGVTSSRLTPSSGGARSASVGSRSPRVFGGSLSSPEKDNLSVDTVDSGVFPSARYAITGYHFGQEFLTRPIDVAVLNDDRVAVSDSCGGVFVCSREGEILQQIWTDQGSASSLYFNHARHELLISVLQRQGTRVIQVHNSAAEFNLEDKLQCPTDPIIELTRTRWIASTNRGDAYIVSGDNSRSAIWKLSSVPLSGSRREWQILRQSKMSRLQSIHLVEDQPEKDHVWLLTCEGVTGLLLLFHISPSGKILRELDMTRQWGLQNLIRSPAAAIYDELKNVLILDYVSGKVWLLPAAELRKSGSKQQAPPVARCLADLGSQRAVGMDVAGNGWCYVASFAKRRVQAVKYLDSN